MGEKRERRRSTRNRSRSRGWSRHERRQDFNDFQRYKRRRSRGRSAVNSDIPPWARTPNRNTCGNTCCIVISSILSHVFMFVAAIYIIDWVQGGDGTNAFAVIGLGRKIAGPKLPPKPPGVPGTGTPSTPGQNL